MPDSTYLPGYAAKNRVGSMLCYPYEDLRLEGNSRKSWNAFPVGVQPKLNGERCRQDPKSKLLLSSTEEVIYSVPHINEELHALKCPFEPDGELYNHGMLFDGPDGIHSIISRTVNLHPNHRAMQYHIFDIASDDSDFIQAKRIAELKRWFKLDVPANSCLKLTPTELAKDRSEVMSIFDYYISLNYEGIIIRHMFASYIRRRNTYVMKFKPKQRDDYKIVDFLEEHDKFGNPKNRFGTFVCTSDTGDTFSVYSGINDDLRRYLWSIPRHEIIGKTITVHYQNLSAGRDVPIFGRVKTSELKTIWRIS